MLTNEEKGENELGKNTNIFLVSTLSLGILAGCSNESSKEVEELKKQVADLESKVEKQEQKEQKVETEVKDSELDSASELSELLGAWVFDSGGYFIGRYIEISENDGLLRIDTKNDENVYEGTPTYNDYEIINNEAGKWSLKIVSWNGSHVSSEEAGKRETIIEIKDGKIITFPLLGDVEYSAVKVDTSFESLKNFEKIKGDWVAEVNGREITLRLEDGYIINSSYDENNGLFNHGYHKILGITEDNSLVTVVEKVVSDNGRETTFETMRAASLTSFETDDSFLMNYNGQESRYTRK